MVTYEDRLLPLARDHLDRRLGERPQPLFLLDPRCFLSRRMLIPIRMYPARNLCSDLSSFHQHILIPLRDCFDNVIPSILGTLRLTRE